MANYEYEGINQNGYFVKGKITAVNSSEARKQLLLQKIEVQKLKKISSLFRSGIKNKDILVFSRQLSIMLQSGITLIRSLEIIANGNENNLSMKNLVLDVKNNIEQGMSLADALSSYDKYFNKLYCGLVSAGETAGTLDVMLDKIGLYQEKMLNIRRKVIGALVYPAVVLTVAVGAVIAILLFILPKFASMYKELGATLPYVTQIVINASNFLYSYGLYILLSIVVLYILFKQGVKKSNKFRFKIDNLIIRVPIFGKIIRNSLVTRWGGTLAILLKSGMTIINSLNLVANASGNLVYETATLNIKEKINKGETLANSLNVESNYLFPTMFIQMEMIGEESGSLENMLEKATSYYEAEVDSAVAILATLIEPLVIVLLGGIIGFMVFAMYAPLFNLGGM